ncbi:phage baseplate assembly protein V, partial [Denitromonas iodatirespirans]|uniref:phage baseplate assembly protein V n=1 Tax=Denitromonas iodatirespirans TaxID=2795389 RepID=UPI0021057FC1
MSPQNARVVGHANAPLSTERDHRIKVQFHWERGAPTLATLAAPRGGGARAWGGPARGRGESPSPGGIEHPVGPDESGQHPSRPDESGPTWRTDTEGNANAPAGASPARRAAPRAGAAPIGGSERSERGGASTTWVRVAEWLAGPNWGSHFLPRIGTDVLVDFIGGDIDRPVIVS